MSTQRPIVSVIIPTYNRRHLIEPAIQGVLDQTYETYELIVVDDASVDGTADWVETHYPWARLIRLERNIGAAAARNVGIRAAKGELIAFLDSDDYWDAGYLSAQVGALAKNPCASFVFSNHREILHDGSMRQCVYRASTKYRDLVHRSLADTFIYNMSAVVVRQCVLEVCGLLDVRLSSCHDRELYIRLLQAGEMAHVEDLLVTRVMHDQNISADYRNWANNIFMTLDLFFENPKNKAYLPLESSIRRDWAMIMARHLWRVDKAPFCSALMVFRAFKAEPGVMIEKLKRKLLLKFA
ncbi:MAG: glycosyltransferase family 2 protein [Phormidesmis sp. RL_2_1]|nr:glycosyltransferase family 2 protein [Phormidesmis sp. RL_2_1]